jgi:hypothetical protein
MKALKLMWPDGSITAYRVKAPIVAAQMIDLTEDELASYQPPIVGEVLADVQTIFQNEGHLTVRA